MRTRDDTTARTGSQPGPERAAPADDLLALSAHELRGPVAAIVGFAETIRTQADRLSPQQLDDALDTIVRQAHRLDNLLGDILLLASGSAGMLALDPEVVRVGEALAEVLRDEAIDAATVVVECDPAVQVYVDRRRFHQMIANYLRNARLHGRPPLAIEVAAFGGLVEVAVRDGGTGVGASHVASLFEHFERGGADPAATGSGLGLAVVRTLAEASGGSAGYRPGSEPGAHAFVVSLPPAP